MENNGKQNVVRKNKGNPGFWILVLLLLALLVAVSGVIDNEVASRREQSVSTEREKAALFLESIKSKETKLYNSYINTADWIEDTNYYPRVPVMETVSGYLDKNTFIYDMALCVITLIDLQEYEKARHHLETFRDNFYMKKNRRQGLFNSYKTDTYDHYFKTPSGKRNVLVMGIDGDRIHLGPNMFVGLAAQTYYFRTGSAEFLEYLLDMFKWAKGFAHYRLPDGNPGGPAMGYGWGVPWQKVFSTENIIDYYAFLNNMLKICGRNDPNMVSAMKAGGVTADEILNELKAVEKHLVTVGFNNRGTFNRGGYGPTEKNEFTIDEIEALDTNSWAITAIGPDNLQRMGIDPEKLIKETDRFKVKCRVGLYSFSGYDFTLGKLRRRPDPLIWWEGTGQMVVAFKCMEAYEQKKGNLENAEKYAAKRNYYLDEMNRFSNIVIKSRIGELSYVSKYLGEKEVEFTFDDWWPIARAKPIPSIGKEGTNTLTNPRYVISVSSTLWRYFAVVGMNVFAVDEPRIN